MKKAIKGLNDRDLEILDILGFEAGVDFLPLFLEKILENPNLSQLHNKGIALRYIKKILKKIDPNHKILKQKGKSLEDKNFYDEDVLELLLTTGSME
ncbi:hypothetical protein JXK06_00910 [Patescibacteria group bacterium]|nr:hypothetical protein [Patescibacteria group bacterium]